MAQKDKLVGISRQQTIMVAVLFMLKAGGIVIRCAAWRNNLARKPSWACKTIYGGIADDGDALDFNRRRGDFHF